MKVFKLLRVAPVFCFLLPLLVSGQTNCNEGAGQLDTAKPSGITEAQIIQKFSAAETEFQRQYVAYGFTQEIKVDTLEGNDVTGEFRRISNVHFDKDRRMEYVTFSPQSSLRGAELSKDDFDDIERSPFILTAKGLPQYNLHYAGSQKVDQLQTYVFDVAPRQLVKGHRYFQGRVWVDQRALQIVKTCGKFVPDVIPEKPGRLSRLMRRKKAQPQNITPVTVTYRELIDGKYWFPTYRRADDVLEFVNGFTTEKVTIREIIKLTNYQRGAFQKPPLMTAK